MDLQSFDVVLDYPFIHGQYQALQNIGQFRKNGTGKSSNLTESTCGVGGQKQGN